MASGEELIELPRLDPGEIVWRPASLWHFSGSMELRAGGVAIADAEWLDLDPPEWRVDAGQRELAFRIAEWKPMRVEVASLPGGRIEMVQQGSKRRPRPAIELGDARYYLAKTGLGRTAYLAENGDVVARMRSKMSWHGGTSVSVRDVKCPQWHLWILACYVGFRVAVSYKHLFKADTSSGLHSLIGRSSDYELTNATH